jgi:integrase
VRIGECLGLKWIDIELDRREIQVARTLAAPKKGPSIEARLDTPKSGKTRRVDMNSILPDVYRDLQAIRKVESMRRGAGGEISPFVFTLENGSLFDESRSGSSSTGS